MEARKTGKTKVGGIIRPPFKLVLGQGPDNTLDMAGWTGPQWPNISIPRLDWTQVVESCGRTPETGCLYNVYDDPAEHHNIAEKKPELFKKLLADVDTIQSTVYSPIRGRISYAACGHAMGHYGGYWGPFLDVDAVLPVEDVLVV